MLRVAGLVDGVVTRDPGVFLVARSDLLPQPDGAILVVLVVPERGPRRRVIGVPIWILAARERVHVEDGVDLVFRALGLSVCPTLTIHLNYKNQYAGLTISITRSKCLKPSSFSTLGFISSSRCL